MSRPDGNEDHAARWLAILASVNTCRWCAHPQARLRSAGLCSHCYRLRSRFRRSLRIHGSSPVSGGDPQLDERVVLGAMIHLAKGEGAAFGARGIHNTSGLDLELQLETAAKYLRIESWFTGDASELGWAFGPSQRSLLYFMLTMFIRPTLRRYRRGLAGSYIDGMLRDGRDPYSLLQVDAA